MANADAKRTCDWLTMIFMGADDDLRQFGDVLLDEVKLVASNERVPILVERDPTKPGAQTLRGEVRQGDWKPQEIGLTNGDAKAIVEFVDYAKREFDAKKRLLILWDHGNGWQNVHPFEHVVALPELETVALGNVLKGSDVDVLGFDACLMAMIEVAYQLRRHVRFMVASENVVQADTGWPYDAILRELTARPEMTPDEVARTIVSMFSGAYNASSDPVTLSALDLSYVEPVVEAISDLSRALIAASRNGGRDAVLLARRYCQSFANPDYIDLVSFCAELQTRASGKIPELARAVQECVAKFVIATTHGSAASVGSAQGVSIYFPDRPISQLYEQLDFAHRSGWATFLTMVTPPQIEPAKPVDPLHAPAAIEPGGNDHRCSHGVVTACTKCCSHEPHSRRQRKAG